MLHTIVYNTALPNGWEGDGGGLGGWSTRGRGSVRALWVMECPSWGYKKGGGFHGGTGKRGGSIGRGFVFGTLFGYFMALVGSVVGGWEMP